MKVPLAYIDHELFIHLLNTKEKAINYAEKLGIKVIQKRLEALSMKLTIDEIRKIIEISSILHDIGKAADYYQKDFSKENSEMKFPLHEVPSAMISEKVCEKLGIKEEAKHFVFLTVLQHMNTMRDWLSENIRINRDWSFNEFKDQIESFIKRNLEIDIEISKINKDDAKKKINEYKKIVSENRYLKLYTLFLVPVTIADSRDAYEFRKTNISPSRRKFIEEVIYLEGNYRVEDEHGI